MAQKKDTKRKSKAPTTKLVSSNTANHTASEPATNSNGMSTVSLPSNPWYEVRSSGEGRGLGVFATRNIPQGTRILSETPQLIVDLSAFTRQEIRAGLETKLVTDSLASSADDGAAARVAQVRQQIMDAFSKLSEEEQASALSLHCDGGNGTKEDIILILKANGFNHGQNGAALCVSSSRFNHACIPNTHFGWNSRIEQQTFHIIKPDGVKKGEEILVCYDEPEALFDVRQKHLLKTYGFTCACQVCVIGRKKEVSERRRAEIKVLMKRVEDFGELPFQMAMRYGVKSPVVWILRVRDLLIEEGLVGLCLARCLRKAGEWFMELENFKKAREFAKEERRIVKYCLGEDHGKMGEVEEWIQGLK